MKKLNENFREWLNESTFNQLYSNTVNAFPNTTKRQHAIDPIEISSIVLLPFVGMNTLYVKSLAQNESREYNPIILFKGVKFDGTGTNLLQITGSDGKEYILERLSFDKNDINVKCNCKDFHWRFQHTDHLDKSLYGKDRKKYEAKTAPGSSNPLELPGMCKHLLKLAKFLKESKIVD